jgi:dipeptidyl aminopeptidase/acylaminoacyl peptidase
MKMRIRLCRVAEIAIASSCIATIGLASAARIEAQNAGKHAITFADMMKMHRVAEPALSPDGKWVVYSVATPDMDANRNASNIWLVSTESGAPIQLTQSGKDSSPVWSPDGKMIAFLSSRGGESQVYLLSLDGGEAHPWTSISTGVDIVRWSPDGKTLAFTSGVYPDCKDDSCNQKREEEKEKNKVKAHVAEHLLYRHWNHWNEGKRGHLFVVPAPTSLDQAEASGKPIDLTPGADYDVPPDQIGGAVDIDF